MNKLKLYFFLPLLLLVGVACEDEDKNPVPLPPNGAMILIEELVVPVFDVTNITNAAFEAKIRDVANNTAQYDLIARVQRGSRSSDFKLVKTLTNFSGNLVITSAEVAAAIDTLKASNYNPNNPATYTLIGGPADFAAGDRIEFSNEIVGVNGVRYTAGDQSPDLASNPGQRSGFAFVTFVSCPFDAASMAGTYSLVFDRWEGFLVADPAIAVVAGPGANQFTIKDIFGHGAVEGRPDGFYDVVVDVNPSTGQATVQRQRSQNSALYGLTFGFIDVDGGGFAFSCTGRVELSFQHRVSAGTFSGGPYEYFIQRD
ncbi:MAG: hypothetical protein OHK0053_07230 [Microscillaceae bacterium]